MTDQPDQPDETMELDFCTCGRQYFQHTDRELLACMRRDLLKAGERLGLPKPVYAQHTYTQQCDGIHDPGPCP